MRARTFAKDRISYGADHMATADHYVDWGTGKTKKKVHPLRVYPHSLDLATCTLMDTRTYGTRPAWSFGGHGTHDVIKRDLRRRLVGRRFFGILRAWARSRETNNINNEDGAWEISDAKSTENWREDDKEKPPEPISLSA